MKKIILICVSAVLLMSFTTSTVATVGGSYKRMIDMELNGVCTGNLDNFGPTLTLMTDKSISGIYWGIDNKSIFIGNVFESTLIQLTQKDPSGYFSIYNGQMDTYGNIAGTWMDSRGNKGDFIFKKQ